MLALGGQGTGGGAAETRFELRQEWLTQVKGHFPLMGVASLLRVRQRSTIEVSAAVGVAEREQPSPGVPVAYASVDRGVVDA